MDVGGAAAAAATAMAADDEDPARRSSCGIVSSSASASANSHVASDAPSAIPAISSPPASLMRGPPSSAAPAMAATEPALSGDRVCFNSRCKGSTSSSWKPGWLLRSGRAADLCEACGLAYEHGRFCDTFHVDETGWRTCISCSKQIHCGCIVSIFSYVLLDSGGVECTSCAYKNNTSRLALESSAMHLSSLATGFQRMEAFPSEGWTHGKMERIAWTPEMRPLFQVPYVPPTNHVGTRHWQTLSGLERQGVSEPISIETTGRMGSAIGYSVKAESDASGIMNAKSTLPKLPVPTQPVNLDLLQRHRNTAVFNTHMSRDDSANFYSDPKVSKEGFLQGDTFTRSLVDGTSTHAATLSWQGTNFKESGSLYGLNGTKNIQHEPPVNASLTMSLGLSNMKRLVTNVTSEPSVSKALFASEKMRDSKEGSKFPEPSAITQKQKQVTSKVPQAPSPSRMEIPKDLKDSTQGSLRVARPPAEGRGKNQLLPRYWPRITEQELQQITSGDSNSSITPLFEKMLSASDAGRIGRLVLPKACAEAYFPSISQPEGVPLKIQDVNGREWSFQFRFWPNNNSRMYVLEGVTPCIQSMQLQAGDTVTFSRLDPEGKLIMGYRRAPSSMNVQDPQSVSMNANSSTSLIPGGGDNVNNTINFSGGPSSQAAKGSAEPGGTSNIMESKHSWSNIENKNSKPKDGSAPQYIATDKKKGRTFGLKGKKPRLEAEDSVDKSNMSWEELQELLQPPANAVPNIVTVDGHEFEEYEEPPVLQECSTPPSRHAWSREESGGQLNDDLDNANSLTRVVCTDDGNIPATPREEVEALGGTRDLLAAGVPSGLEALANAATMGENKASSSSPTPTTKHPRHRSGCTCIVCIQPPSGKGPKHKATCTCNVCTTVKRRFKTLMMRRKKRQSEQEEESVRKKSTFAKESSSGNKTNDESRSMPERKLSSAVPIPGGSSNRRDFPSVKNTIVPLSSSTFSARPKSMEERTIDLNSQPERDEEAHKDTGSVSMMMLFQSANYTLEKYLQQQGISDLSCNVSTARLEEQIRTPHILKSESSEDQDCGLTQANVDGSKGGYDIDYIMEALNPQVSSQSS